jgi:F-type H+-transporting ATPase subunit gamma
MANLIDIRRRIRSVKNTQQITKAMKMVAAAKLRRAQDRILATRPYALELGKVMADLAARETDGRHPLFTQREEKKVLLVVVTGDKGLCGSFNSNVIRRSREALARLEESELLLLGRKGTDFFKRRDIPIRQSYTTLFSNVEYEAAAEIADAIGEAYMKKEYDAVYVVYNQFKSMMVQLLTEERLLPIAPPSAEGEGQVETEVEYEPTDGIVLAEIVPLHLRYQVYRVLLESQAAEHAARMTAMDGATKNAGEMIDRLTLTYNRARQAAITTELIEVVSGAEALEG